MNKPEEELFLYYKGPILYDTIGYLIGELKEKMFESQVKQSIYKKVLMVMIEALENVFKYHEYFDKERSVKNNFNPELSILRSKTYFTITCSNPIRKIDVAQLQKRLDFINSLDKQGIKEEYKKTITDGQFSEKGGAGLGLIEMAKITDSKLYYLFTSIDDLFEYYRLTLNIKCG